MLFSSYIFIFAFLPFVWLGFHILKSLPFAASYTCAKLFLVLASLFFYTYFKLEYLPILLGSIVINYLFALAILRFPSRSSRACAHSLASDYPVSKLGGGAAQGRI